jgi:hypothetical protein
MKLILKRGSDEGLSDEALSALNSIPKIEIEQQSAVYLEGRGGMPAIWLPDGTIRAGIDAIHQFVSEQSSPAVRST